MSNRDEMYRESGSARNGFSDRKAMGSFFLFHFVPSSSKCQKKEEERQNNSCTARCFVLASIAGHDASTNAPVKRRPDADLNRYRFEICNFDSELRKRPRPLFRVGCCFDDFDERENVQDSGRNGDFSRVLVTGRLHAAHAGLPRL